MTTYSDRYWLSGDGLRLHYRDYPGRADRPPVVCLHGLTRNARDFANLAERLAGEWRVLCPEMRGRGQSEYASDPLTYTPQHYVADVNALFDATGITRFVAIGTSLGGLMIMLLAMQDASSARNRIAGALLNDVGPEVDSAGLERIRGYVGQAHSFADWAQAAEALAATQAVAFPDYRPEDWLAMAHRVMTKDGGGRLVFDYDMNIAKGFAEASTGLEVDLWPGIDALAGRPVLLVRGGLSDLLGEATLAKMQQRLPESATVTVPRVGHAPTLDEPEATAAIERWLNLVA
jgi:pimeloyl-ACP methyl ester carboxylesterase